MGISTANDVSPIFLEQVFKADVDIKPNEEGWPFSVTLSNIRDVKAITVDPDGAIVTSLYRGFDTTAVQIASATGANLILQVKPENDISLIYKVNSVDEDPVPGTLTLNAWNTGSPTAVVGAFVGGRVSVTVFPHAAPPWWDFGLSFNNWFVAQNNERNNERNNEMIVFATYEENGDKSYGILTFKNPGAGGPSVVPASSKWGTPWVITGKSVGSKKTATMVGFLDRVCVDGRRIELKISKKGLKSKGCAAKKAVAGFKSGAYELLNIAPIRMFKPADSSNPPQGDGWMFDAWLAPTIPTKEGTLTKTDVLGTYTLKFTLGEKERVYKYDEKKKEVSSKSANIYLGEVAPSLPVTTLVKLRLESLETVIIPMPQIYGLMFGLAWSTPADAINGWNATVKTSLADAEMLGDVTDVKRITIFEEVASDNKVLNLQLSQIATLKNGYWYLNGDTVIESTLFSRSLKG